MNASSPPVNTVGQQQQCRTAAIACLQSRLARYQQSPIELKAQLQPYLETLKGLQQKLTLPLLQIAVFGLVSRGKSAVLNALFGEPIFPTGPLNGVTQWPRAVRWAVPLPQDQTVSIQIELVDTPGLDEISGAARAAMAQDIARCADLILFVTAGPPLPVEEEALAELAQLTKPLIWVVNKADLYPELSAEYLYQSLTQPSLQGILSPREIVLTSAAPAPVQVRHEWPDGRTSLEWEIPLPQVSQLRQTLLDLLEREGLYLLSLNVLLQVQTTEQQMVEVLAQFYAPSAQAMQWQWWSFKAILVGLNPWAWLDLLLSFGLDLTQVRQLMQVYHLPATSHNIRALWKKFLLSGSLIAVGEVGTTGLGWLLQGLEGTPGVAAIFTQGAIAAYSAAMVGQMAQQYLLQGATWDPQGPSALIQTVLGEIQTEMVINRFSRNIASPSANLNRPALIHPSEKCADGFS